LLPTSADPPLYTLSLHDALPISPGAGLPEARLDALRDDVALELGEGREHREHQLAHGGGEVEAVLLAHKSDSRALQRGQRVVERSEEHTSELQSRSDLVCRLLLE